MLLQADGLFSLLSMVWLELPWSSSFFSHGVPAQLIHLTVGSEIAIHFVHHAGMYRFIEHSVMSHPVICRYAWLLFSCSIYPNYS
jgi:hypothetical protein